MTAPARAVPYFCPFCAEESLFPREAGGWHCRSCRRAFSLTFHGIENPAAVPILESEQA